MKSPLEEFIDDIDKVLVKHLGRAEAFLKSVPEVTERDETRDRLTQDMYAAIGVHLVKKNYKYVFTPAMQEALDTAMAQRLIHDVCHKDDRDGQG